MNVTSQTAEKLIAVGGLFTNIFIYFDGHWKLPESNGWLSLNRLDPVACLQLSTHKTCAKPVVINKTGTATEILSFTVLPL